MLPAFTLGNGCRALRFKLLLVIVEGGFCLFPSAVVSLPFRISRDPTLKRLPEKLADCVFHPHWRRGYEKSWAGLSLALALRSLKRQ